VSGDTFDADISLDAPLAHQVESLKWYHVLGAGQAVRGGEPVAVDRPVR
jgi:hypothetical protein